MLPIDSQELHGTPLSRLGDLRLFYRWPVSLLELFYKAGWQSLLSSFGDMSKLFYTP